MLTKDGRRFDCIMHSHIPPKKFLSMKGFKKIVLVSKRPHPNSKSQTALSLEKLPMKFYLHENEPVRGTSFHMNVFFNEDSF